LSDSALRRLRKSLQDPGLDPERYRLVRELGRGGMGAVYLVEDLKLPRQLALKVLDLPDPDGQLARRLQAEAQILASLEHPGIAPIHEVGQLDDGRPYYTMRYVAGQTLAQYARSPVPLSERLRVFQRVLETIAFAHAHGVLHRDLKPDNIMVGPFGEVLVMDWGLATPISNAVASAQDEVLPFDPARVATGQGKALGTPGFMAPEQQRRDDRQLDQRADIFSLGAVLQALIGVGTAGTSLPAALEAICRRAMSTDPGMRYESAQEMSQEIERFIEGRRVEAHRERFWQRGQRIYAHHKVAIWLVLAYLVVRGALLFSTGR
jgi:serine/threonine protein kinase